MGQILTNELDKTSTNVATWHELKTKPRTTTNSGRRRRGGGEGPKKKKKKKQKKKRKTKKIQPQIPTEFPKETERANEAKAILRTWLRGRAAGAVSPPPASCGDAGRRRRRSRAVRGTRPAGGRPVGGPGPRWGSRRQAGRRACSQRSRRGRARMAAASWPGAPAGRASRRARGVAFVQSVVSSLWRGRRAWRGRTEESLVSFHLKRVGWRSCLHLVCSERTFFFS